MKKYQLLAVLLGIAASSAFAGSFDGPFVQANIGGASTQVEGNYGSILGSKSSDAGNFLGQIQAGYSQSFDVFNLSGSAFYIVGNQNGGTNTATLSGAGGSVSANQTFQLKNTWGLSIEPGLYVSDNTLGYLKFSWFNSDMSYNGNMTVRTPRAVTNGSASVSNIVNGAGFGVGVKHLFTDNIYGAVEYQYVQYGSWSDSNLGTSYKPNQNYGWVGIGYKF